MNVNVIASEPNSQVQDNYRSYAEEQLKDDDIQWIKKLIITNADQKPIIKNFNNNIQKTFYREYERLRIVENILYRATEDVDGFNRTQFVLPKQVAAEVVEQIHTSIYNANLRRKKRIKNATKDN